MNEFNLETAIANQEANENKVQNEAVVKAKEEMARKKLEAEARKVESRLSEAEREETAALKTLRYDRKKADIQKKYLETISKAKTEFETTGDCAVYDKAVSDADQTRSKELTEAKKSIYGDDYWRF
jgi:hypothetical protein